MAVVAAGNLLFHAVRRPVAADPSTIEHVDYYNKKKRKLERHLRTIERFFGVEPEPPPPPRSPQGVDREPEPSPVACSQPREIAVVPEPVLPPAALPAPAAPAVLAYFESEAPAFAWPEPLPPPAVRPVDLPRSVGDFDAPIATPELVASFLRTGASDCFTDAMDALFKGPEYLLDGIVSLAAEISPRPEVQVWDRASSGGITSRIFDFQTETRNGRIFSNFMDQLVEREQRYFSRFEDSSLGSVAFEEGTADIETDDLIDAQRKILWDALRKTYLSKYKIKAEDRIRDEAFYFNEWRGVDFAVLPPLMAAYLWYRGLDKKVSMGGTWMRVSFEPISRWVGRHEDLIAGISFEWSIKGLPVGVIVTGGLYGGDLEMDFVGIGTSVGMARKALAMQQRED